jgi:hypothetical protein
MMRSYWYIILNNTVITAAAMLMIRITQNVRVVAMVIDSH